jgi:hypothetical protein
MLTSSLAKSKMYARLILCVSLQLVVAFRRLLFFNRRHLHYCAYAKHICSIHVVYYTICVPYCFLFLAYHVIYFAARFPGCVLDVAHILHLLQHQDR